MNLFSQILQKLQKVPSNVGAYFNPTSNHGNNFWSTPIAQDLGKAQNFVEWAATKPRVNFTPIQQQYHNPLVTFGTGVAQDLLNTPSNIFKAGVQGGTDYRTGKLNLQHPKVLLSDIGQAADPVLNIATFGVGKSVAEQLGKQGIKELLAQGAKTGFKLGAGYGLSSSVQANRNTADNSTYFKNLLKDTAVGAGTGALVGAGTAGVGVLSKHAGELYKASPLSAQTGSTTIDTLTGGLGKKIVGKTPPVKGGIAGDISGKGFNGGIAGDVNTEITNLGGIRKLLDRSRNLIASQGEGGKNIADMLKTARDQEQILTGQWLNKVPTVRSLNKNEFANMVDVAEGKAQPISDKVAQAAGEWDSLRKEVLQRAKSVPELANVGNLKNYFPHIYPKETFQRGTQQYNDAMDNLISQGNTEAQAARILANASDTIRNRRFGNLEKSRTKFEIGGYKKTPDTVGQYLQGVAKRVSHLETFGAGDENVLKQIAKIGRQGGDTTLVKNLFDTASGANTQEASSAVRAVLGLNRVTSLSTSSIANLTQSVNTGSVVGVMRVVKNIPKAFTQEGKDWGEQTGVAVDTVLNSIKKQAGEGGKLSKVTAPGFNVVESFNRRLAALSGADYADSLFKKGDYQTLEKMGITVNPGQKALSEAQRIQAGRSIVERTQFLVDPQDLPGWAESSLGRLVLQFRTFSYNQSAFVGRELIQPALHGNVLPLSRFLLVGIPAGYASNKVRDAIKFKQGDPNQSLADKAISGFGGVGGLGLAGDIATGFIPNQNYGDYSHDKLDPTAYTLRQFNNFGGPSARKITDVLKSGASLASGNPTPAEKLLVGNIPLVGTSAKNILFPSNNTPAVAKNFSAPATDPLQGIDLTTPSQPSNPFSNIPIVGNTINSLLGNSQAQNPITDANASTTSNQPQTLQDLIAQENQKAAQNRFIGTTLGDTTLNPQQKKDALLKAGVTQDMLNTYYISKLNSAPTEDKAKYIISQGSQADFTKLYKDGTLTLAVAKEMERQGYIPDATALMDKLKMTDVYYQKQAMKDILTKDIKAKQKIQHNNTVKSVSALEKKLKADSAVHAKAYKRKRFKTVKPPSIKSLLSTKAPASKKYKKVTVNFKGYKK